MAITKKEYAAFQKAYDYFNQGLFSGKLPGPIVKNMGVSFIDNASEIEVMKAKPMN